MTMRKQFVLILLVALAVIAGQPAVAQDKTPWANPGADPFALSPEEAINKLHGALIALNIPEPARALLEAEVKAHPEGERYYITPTDTFEAMMWSPGGNVRHNVSLKDIPIALKGKSGMVLSARARIWRVKYQDQTVVLVDPEICNNWAWYFVPAPKEEKRASLDCVEIHSPHVHAGDRMTLTVNAEAADLPPSECWAYKVAGEWKKWPECLTCFTADGPMEFRVPRAVAEKHEISICWEHNGKPSHKIVMTPAWWKVHSTFPVPDLEADNEQPVEKAGS